MQSHNKKVLRSPFVRHTLWQLAGAAALAVPGAGMAQSMPNKDHGKMSEMDHSKMDHGKMSEMDHSKMDHSKMDHSKMDHSKMPEMDHSKMGHDKMPGMDPGKKDQGKMPGMDMGGDMKMDMGSMQGGSAPPDARDPDAYSDGLEHGPMPGMDMADDDVFVHVQVDQLEAFKGKGDDKGQAYDAQAWIGTDLNKLWLKSSGERANGRLGAVRTEALYNRAIAPYWGLQAGIRQDSGDGPGRTWAAFGVQGLAPYWFDVEATAYVGNGSRTALRLEAKYEILLTQRLILQPDIEFNFYGKSDRERGIGSGLSDIEAGLRLRYEITRKVAPYVGVSWSRKVGNTAEMARAAGKDVRESRIVAGIRFWF